MPKDTTGPEAIAKRERMARALKLRKSGATYRQIGEQLGVSISTAHEYVRDALAEVTKEPAETVLALELERLDGMLLGIAKQANSGDLKAIDRALRIMVRRDRLTGLDALAILRIQGEGREMAAVDQFHAAMLGEKADDDRDDE
ncbi:MULTISPECIES: helix-turn-helix domain-containing protein [Nocardia]|uniref:helix-turn-helix domain-containing protein n=1 Tax=Nocardia TaxID=1817 RepID=UPI002454BAEC|nr:MULTISPECIES: helix-turn-helix domain-containing protein [Nocardia]